MRECECEYGCGSIGKYILSNNKHCCSSHYNKCPAKRKKNSDGLKRAYANGTKNNNHLKSRDSWSKGKVLIDENVLFCKNSTSTNASVKRALIALNKLDYVCSQCGIYEWQGNYITLELDHINGDNRDNQLYNLRLLCPNCHSQTDTFRGRNKNKGTLIVSDSDLLEAIKNTSNIRQALIAVGLAAKGGNYTRAKRLISKHVK